MRITQNELLEALALASASSAPEDAKTAAELAEEAGMGIRATREALTVLKRDGRLLLHSITREAIDGRRSRLTGYTILPKR